MQGRIDGPEQTLTQPGDSQRDGDAKVGYACFRGVSLDEQTLTNYLLSISVIFLSLPYPAHSDIRRVMASDTSVLFSYPAPSPPATCFPASSPATQR
jgi:hypothetical protein